MEKYIPSNVKVIYTSSNEDFEKGYELCKGRFQQVKFIKEKDFYQDTVNAVSSFEDSVCFTTDDTIIFNSVDNLSDVKRGLESNGDCAVFSFRLGYNTVIQDHIRGTKQPSLIPGFIVDNLLVWEPSFYRGNNYGYPHALDMHLYKKDYILPILQEIQFTNSNQLEGILQKYNNRVKYLFSPKESVAVNVPLNNLSGLTMVNGINTSCKDANDQYLNRKRLVYKFDRPIIGAHQELDYEFIDG